MFNSLPRIFYPLFSGVIAIQGIHVLEHVIQLVQVYLFGVPDDEALGLLGYVFQFDGTEEWLHLAFNAGYVLALYALLLLMRPLVRQALPLWVLRYSQSGLLAWKAGTLSSTPSSSPT